MRRFCFRRGLSAAVLLTMTLSLALPASAADPLPPAALRRCSSPPRRPTFPRPPSSCPCISGTEGPFLAVDTLDFDTPVNRVTKDVEFHLIPKPPRSP